MNLWAKAGIAVAVVAAVVAATVLLVRPGGEDTREVEMLFTTSPQSVDVTVDGEDYGGVATGESLTVEAGAEIDVEVHREGFEAFTTTLDRADDGPTHVDAALLPMTDEAWDLIAEEEELQEEQETTESYLRNAEQAYKDHPILRDLPRETNTFSAFHGVPESPGYDFAVYVELYSGAEDVGRDDFNAWVAEEGYDTDEFEVIEEVSDEGPPPTEAPSMEELEELDRGDVEIPEEVSADGLTAEELAVRFAQTSTTWDAGSDAHHTDGLRRAAPLMTTKQADSLEEPMRPTSTSKWRAATEAEARSRSWVAEYEETESGGDDTTVTLDVCWAWISDGAEPVIDGPRTYEVTVSEDDDGPRISHYTYEDPDPFVDNSDTSCNPEDA